MRHGHGKLTFKDGRLMKGISYLYTSLLWNNIIVLLDWISFYRGSFVREQMCGIGTYVGSNCTQYEVRVINQDIS